jgi:hypothetical protein
MAKIYQDQNPNENVRDNFPMHELRSGSSDAPESWYLDNKTLDALQAIRDWYGAMVPSSTGRTKSHQAKIGSSLSSMHYLSESNSATNPVKAIDFQFTDSKNHNQFIKDMLAQNGLYTMLRRQYGLSIGLYDNFIHIDTGGGAGVAASSIKTDQYGRFGFWDLSSKKKT